MAAADRHDGPVAQLNLLRSIILTDWSTSLDHKVSAIIIDRYYPKYGGARASLRFLEEGTGSTRPNIIASVRRLVAHGAFSVKVEGRGTRPTEYSLNFGFASSGIADDTSASGTAGNTSCGIADDTSSPDSGIADDTETYLPVPAYNAGLQEGRNFEAAPLAPPADGLSATAAETASGDGFAEFWAAWPRKHGLKKARAEWAHIQSDVDIVIDAAKDRAAHYLKHGTDKKWIPEPANWLKGERWNEDLPLIHIDAKGAAIAKAKANATPKPAATSEPPEPANDDAPLWMRGSPESWPIGRHEGVFIDGEVDQSGGDTSVFLTFKTTEGETMHHYFYTEACIKSYQEEGRAIIRNIMNALNMSNCEDTDELLYKPLAVVADGKALTYRRISEAA
ncbi:hypothetical protein B5M44_21525 [Shinella sumterensis]|uniref:hypothetical protein n=1 Tax=Shinella sumterensis TaxID=1967501 RepID=UPI00106DD6C4|nr:hypothetical protein [Shinella sumterensis]MCD1266844.1 hypothetical protein [Shinella sumterensis]TFE95298.1 hypothetical protein B5M44_21525 [Shinella sumterensis]